MNSSKRLLVNRAIDHRLVVDSQRQREIKDKIRQYSTDTHDVFKEEKYNKASSNPYLVIYNFGNRPEFFIIGYEQLLWLHPLEIDYIMSLRHISESITSCL